ncbi:MAG: hypothetical protein AAF614_08065 [Chloroflexota bacterium]
MQRRTILLAGLALVIAYLLIIRVAREEQNGSIPLPLDLPTERSSWTRAFFTRRFVVEQVSLRAGNSVDCLVENGRFTISVETTCTFSLQPSDRWTRQLSLALGRDGGSVAIRLTQPNQVSVEESIMAGDEPMALDVFRRTDEQMAELVVFDCTPPPAPPSSDDEEGVEGAETASSCVLLWEKS